MLRRAIEDSPQVVTRNGEELVVVMAPDAYRRLQSEIGPTSPHER